MRDFPKNLIEKLDIEEQVFLKKSKKYSTPSLHNSVYLIKQKWLRWAISLGTAGRITTILSCDMPQVQDAQKQTEAVCGFRNYLMQENNEHQNQNSWIEPDLTTQNGVVPEYNKISYT